MAVCLVTGGNYHYSGLCDFSAITHYTTIVAYAGLRVKASFGLKKLPRSSFNAHEKPKHRVSMFLPQILHLPLVSCTYSLSEVESKIENYWHIFKHPLLTQVCKSD